MSKAEEATGAVMCCANCGIAGVDEIKLEECDGCDLVLCGSEWCRVVHRQKHEEECKKRAGELHDKRLFAQPDGTHRGECPICFLPNPIDAAKSAFMACCGKTICMGCGYTHLISNKHDRVKRSRCLFCRTSPIDKGEYEKREMERIEANDPASLNNRGSECYDEGDYDKALKYLTKAAELGYAEAHFLLGYMYGEGVGVEKDLEKEVYHNEKAAIGGHPDARYNLAFVEAKNGNTERGVKHMIIAANLGHDNSMKALLRYKEGHITKEEYGATLRTYTSGCC